MAAPVCPPDFICKFTPKHPSHVYDPWWTGPWGQWAALIGIIALAIVLIVFIFVVKDARESRRADWRNERERQRQEVREREERQNRLDVEEQRTMQLDAAKGNPDMLRVIREMQKEERR